MKRALVAVLSAVSIAGCAGLQTSDTRSAEHALRTSGFQALSADTSAKLAQLRSLPPRTLVRRTQAGQPRYVYADPANCHCLYGRRRLRYQQLRRQEQAAEKKFFAIEDSGDSTDFGLWDIGPR